MFEITRALHPVPQNPETAFSHLTAALLDALTGESQLTALRQALMTAVPREILCGRWSVEIDPDRREFRGGRRVEQALTEIERLGYRPAPLIASVLSELQGLIPHDDLFRHVSLQKLFDKLPDPGRREPGAAALQRFLNGMAGKDHYSCLYFESSIIDQGRRSAGIFGRETMQEIVPGSLVLVVPGRVWN